MSDRQNINFKAVNLSHYFIQNKWLFKDLNFELNSGDSVAITGDNGTGKSTLLRIITKLITPISGKIEFKTDDKAIDLEIYNKYYSYISPSLNLYEEFTLLEHCRIIAKMRGLKIGDEFINTQIDYFQLFNQRNNFIKTYSSGMKQRAKFIICTLHNPIIHFFDEPTMNLDAKGVALFEEFIEDQKKENKIIVIASNIENEIILCKQRIELQ